MYTKYNKLISVVTLCTVRPMMQRPLEMSGSRGFRRVALETKDVLCSVILSEYRPYGGRTQQRLKEFV
jgi:hypothetical protein